MSWEDGRLNLSPEETKYQEAVRQYQVDLSKYETDARAYQARLLALSEDEARPSRPIPPTPPIRPLKFDFGPSSEIPGPINETDEFNRGVETVALAVEKLVQDFELVAYIRKLKR